MAGITKKGGKKFLSGRKRKMMSFSDRSGLPFPYSEMIYEPDTKVWLHKSESDGSNNRIALAKRETIFTDKAIPAEARPALPDDSAVDTSWPDNFI